MQLLWQLSQWDLRNIKLVDLQGRVDDSQLEAELEQYSNIYLVSPYNKDQLKHLVGRR